MLHAVLLELLLAPLHLLLFTFPIFTLSLFAFLVLLLLLYLTIQSIAQSANHTRLLKSGQKNRKLKSPKDHLFSFQSKAAAPSLHFGKLLIHDY